MALRRTGMRTNEEMLAEIEAVDGPEPLETLEGPALRELTAARLDRDAALKRVDEAVLKAREAGASWRMIGAVLGVSKQAAARKYRAA